MDCSTLGFSGQHRLSELAQTHVHRVSDAIQPSHPLLFPSPPAFNLSQHQGLFQWVSSLHQVAKVLSFSFSYSPSKVYSGLISFRIDSFRFDILEVHSSKPSILQCSVFFMIQFSHTYMITEKNHSVDYIDLCCKSSLCFSIHSLGLS